MRLFQLYIICFLFFSCYNERNSFLNTDPDVKYVGINQCAACHTEKYESFLKTGMGKSFSPALKVNSSSNFNQSLYDSNLFLHYHPHWIGDSLFVNEYQFLDNDTIHDLTYKIDYIIGSGHHTNSHLFENENGYLYQAPFTYYTQDSILDFPPGFENNKNSRFSRKMGLECVACHNAYPDFVMGSENKYNSMPLGIDCERCHGPGELHVNQIKAGNIIDTAHKVDYTIVNPSKLSIQLQNDLCARCHLQGNAVLQEKKSFFDFRPGMYLKEIMDVYLPRYSNSENEFIMASHVDRMQLSECYIQSNQELSCVTCHNPHVSVKEVSNNFFNSRCFQCHSDNSCKESETNHFHNDCVQCHMSNSTTLDIPHVKITDHKIKIPEEKIDSSGEVVFLGLECVNNTTPSVESITQAYLQQYERFESYDYYLDSASVYLNEIDINSKKGFYIHVYYLFLTENYNKILEKVNFIGLDLLFNNYLTEKDYSNQDAWTSYRIGEAYMKENQSNDALQFYQKSIELAPYNLEFRNKYGVCLFENDKIDFAIDEFQFIISEDSGFVSAYTNLGYAYSFLGEYDKAFSYYNYALQLNPYHEKTLLNKISLHLLEEDVENALFCINKILTLNPLQEEANYLLNQINDYKN